MITFGNKTFFTTQCLTRVFKIICMQYVLCVCTSSCKFTRGNKSQPKHKTIIEDLDNIILDFTRLWFISAAVASVKFLLCCSCSGATFGLFLTCLWKIYLLISITNSHCLQNNTKLPMKIKLLCETMQDFSPCSLFALPLLARLIKSIKSYY